MSKTLPLWEVSPFEPLSPDEATALRELMEVVEMPAGEEIISRGDIGDALYVVEEGTAVVRATEEDGTTRVIAKLGAGQVFGEIALVADTWRTFDVVSGTEVRLLRLLRSDYDAYMADHADVAHKMAVLAARRAVGRDEV